MKGDAMPRHLVLVGAGHAHLTTLVNLERFITRGHRVSVVGPSPYHYYSGMGPGMLGGRYLPEQIRFPVKKMAAARGAYFVQAGVSRIDPGARTLVLDTGDTIGYDIVSCNTGSGIPEDFLNASLENTYPVKPIEQLLKARNRLLELTKNGSPQILVIGGGPAGVEITGNLWRLVNNDNGAASLTMVAGTKLLTRFPEKARKYARDSLLSRNITVIEKAHVRRLDQGAALLDNGTTIHWDICFLAVGIRPSTLFKRSGIATDTDGGMLVNASLQSVSHPEIFGGGDCIGLRGNPVDKVGVYAVRQNPILFHNLLAALEGEPLKRFQPQDAYLLLFNLGNGRAIFCRKNMVWEGRSMFALKNFIDTRFMKKFLDQ